MRTLTYANHSMQNFQIIMKSKKSYLICAAYISEPLLTCKSIFSELKTLECDILNPDLLINLEIKFMRQKSNT